MLSKKKSAKSRKRFGTVKDTAKAKQGSSKSFEKGKRVWYVVERQKRIRKEEHFQHLRKG